MYVFYLHQRLSLSYHCYYNSDNDRNNVSPASDQDFALLMAEPTTDNITSSISTMSTISSSADNQYQQQE